ncbi:phosphate propanoyltransferase [Salipaludibacillus daqingensis]|uniref:phosphate propanoyltransferase n=1 Tax=Salipaludibacillus daqingensis TaxID=3041001 RepID=UPI00247728EA|nr:phosphate propanoyltransferase [Salipaludibacillus daqingensis]
MGAGKPMAYDNDLRDKIVQDVLHLLRDRGEEPFIPIGVSNRHIHLSRDHLETLFGKGYQLTKWKDLKQPGQFAANETVTLIGDKGIISNVRILGPLRKESQVEVSLTDSYRLGMDIPIRESGKTEGTPGIVLKGPKGIVVMTQGVIVALRHIHMPPAFAEKHGIKNKSFVSVEFSGKRRLVFDHVLIRVSDQFVLEMHLDTDEANSAAIQTNDTGKIVKG